MRSPFKSKAFALGGSELLKWLKQPDGKRNKNKFGAVGGGEHCFSMWLHGCDYSCSRNFLRVMKLGVLLGFSGGKAKLPHPPPGADASLPYAWLGEVLEQAGENQRLVPSKRSSAPQPPHQNYSRNSRKQQSTHTPPTNPCCSLAGVCRSKHYLPSLPKMLHTPCMTATL